MKGLGVSMLRLTRRFFEFYPQIRQPAVAESRMIPHLQIRQPLVTESTGLEKSQPSVGESVAHLPTSLPPAKVLELSWTHLIELIRLDDPWKRAFYENECLKGGWSKRQLQRQIGSLLYERTGLSTDKQAVIEHSRRQAAEAPPLIADLSLLAKECTTAAYAVGLDPYVGFYHQPRHGRPALALDVMEEFRPLIAESAVLTAINNRYVTPRDFVTAGRAVNLSPAGRKQFFQCFEQRMSTLIMHPVFDYKVSYRRAVELQFRILARVLTGEIPGYVPFLTR